MTPTLRDLAEDAFAYMDGPNVELDRRAELILRNDPTPHPMFGLALRPRLRDVDRALAETRAWFAGRGRTIYTWFVSTASTPSGLAERLLDRGLQPDQLDPVYAGMTLEHEPQGIEGVEVRRRETYEDALAAVEISWRSFDFTPEQIERARAAHRARYELWKDDGRFDGFIALVDGEIVGSGAARYFESGVYLMGGNVAEEARGRGVYRALVRARWDEAARRGTPALVVQAGQMSKPILERLGFRTVCEVHALLDSTS
jgi:predicted N-acetyltransferase YhbS